MRGKKHAAVTETFTYEDKQGGGIKNHSINNGEKKSLGIVRN